MSSTNQCVLGGNGGCGVASLRTHCKTQLSPLASGVVPLVKYLRKWKKMEEMEESGGKLSLGWKRVGGFIFVFYLSPSYFVSNL